MGTFAGIDIIAAGMNLFLTVVFFLVFALLRIRARNEEVYFPKWHDKGLQSPLKREDFVPSIKFSIRNIFPSYFTSFKWIPAVLKVPEHMLIEHAGLDSAVYLRIYLTGLKILVPICVIVFATVVPVNYTNETLDPAPEDDYEAGYLYGIDKLSIFNVPLKSKRFWAHIVVAYTITLWTCYVLKGEYQRIAAMRRDYIAAERQRPSRYTVLVRNVPSDPDKTVSQQVENFFKGNYPDDYLTHQLVYEASMLLDLKNEREECQKMLDKYQLKYAENKIRPTTKRGSGFLGCFGYEVKDAIDFYTSEIESLNDEISAERLKVEENPVEYIKGAAFVFFKTGWGAAVCAQTQQCKNPKIWPTEWAPEPRDVSWNNLPFSSLSYARELIVTAFFFLLTFASTIASTFALSYLTIYQIPGFKPIAETFVISSIFGALLPQIPLMFLLIIFEYLAEKMIIYLRLSSLSATVRRNASWGYILLFINSFLLIVIPADGYKELIQFLSHSPLKMAEEICMNIPKKDSFFIAYIMLSGTGVASEILQFKSVIRLKMDTLFNAITKTNSISLGIDQEPDIQIYILVALVYAVISPMLLLAVILFLALSYLVYRNQFINVYHQEYESAAEYWPDVHGRIIVALISSQILLTGFLITQKVRHSFLLLLPLCLFTIAFYRYCKVRYEPAFHRYPMQAVREDDELDQREQMMNLEDHLINAYTNPGFKDEADEGDLENGLQIAQQHSSFSQPRG